MERPGKKTGRPFGGIEVVGSFDIETGKAKADSPVRSTRAIPLDGGDEVLVPVNHEEDNQQAKTRGGNFRNRVRAQQLSMVAERTWIEILVALLALAAFTSSVAAVAMVGGKTVRAACAIMFLLSPYSYYQQTRITDIKALKETYSALKGEVDSLAKQNKELTATVSRLSEVVGNLEDVEKVMEAISDTQGQSVESLKATVEENRKTVERMEGNINSKVIDNIFNVVRNCDANHDGTISDEETNLLIESLGNVRGVNVNAKRFKAIVEEGNGSVESVRKIIMELLDNEAGDAAVSFKKHG